jgi:hypothetical protein
MTSGARRAGEQKRHLSDTSNFRLRVPEALSPPGRYKPWERSTMSVHVICPSLRCRKILSLGEEVRGTLVACRYCQMQFRVPQLRRPFNHAATAAGAAASSATSAVKRQ